MDRLTQEERDALVNLAHHPSRAQRGLFALAIALVLLSLAGLRMVDILTNTNNRVDSNRQAIRVSCTLLANAIIQSGSGNGRASNAQPSPQQQLTALYISVIVRQMDGSERKEYHRLLDDATASGGNRVDVPDCERIARHPEAVTIVRPLRR